MPSLVALRADYGPIVLVPRTVVATMQRYQEADQLSREAGGTFIGMYRGLNIEIVACTEPMKRDVRRKYSFDRLDPLHSEIIDRHWKSSGNTLTYVGEWHTHPEPVPEPSPGIDMVTWKSQVSRLGPLPLVFGICGIEKTKFWLGTKRRIVCLESI